MEVQLCTPAYSTSQITWFFKLYAYIYIYITRNIARFTWESFRGH